MSSDVRPPEGDGRRAESRRWARVVPGTPVVLSQVEGMSYAAEQYRNLAFQVEQRKQQLDGESLIVAMSSPDSGTGKTLTALNLALTLAREGDQEVLLVEGDLWKPTLRQYLELDPKTPGLAQLLSGACTLDEAVATVWGTDLDVVMSGEMGRTTGLMAQRRLVRAVEEMRPRYKFVVIDSPPSMLASGRALAACADAVLEIVRSGQTKRRGIEESLSILDPEKVLGFVLNAARPTSEAGYAYYSGYARALEEAQGRAPGAVRSRRWRIGGAVATALASIAVGFWLLQSSPGEAPTPDAAPGLTEPPAPSGVALEPVEPVAESPPAPAGSTLTADLLEGARTAAGAVTYYDVSYVELPYPGGDPGLERGTAADLVVRAFRQAGLDLQQEIHDDLRESRRSYRASEPDTNIDHRRVRNLMTWFERHGVQPPAGDWQPGDVVFWSTDQPGWPNHVGIVSDRRAPSGNWMVIHHFKASTTGGGAEEDALTRWPIEGHYRWIAAQGG